MENIIPWLNLLNTEYILILMLILCFGTIILLHRFFGKDGLYAYMVLAIVLANIQVLKAVKFSFADFPIALGTVVFTSIFLCTDILSEYYGKRYATKAVFLSFTTYLFSTLVFILTIGYKPLDTETAGANMAWNIPYTESMNLLFTPAPALFFSSVIAYLISQLNDITVFHWLRNKTNQKFLWLRNIVSTSLSTLIDNTIFSVLAFIVFTKQPLDFNTVIFTYVLGFYWLRLLFALLDTPFIYLARYLKTTEKF